MVRGSFIFVCQCAKIFWEEQKPWCKNHLLLHVPFFLQRPYCLRFTSMPYLIFMGMSATHRTVVVLASSNDVSRSCIGLFLFVTRKN